MMMAGTGVLVVAGVGEAAGVDGARGPWWRLVQQLLLLW